MIQRKFLQNALIGSVAVAFGGARLLPGANENGPVVKSAIAIMTGDTVSTNTGKATAPTIGLSKIAAALTEATTPASSARRVRLRPPTWSAISERTSCSGACRG